MVDGWLTSVELGLSGDPQEKSSFGVGKRLEILSCHESLSTRAYVSSRACTRTAPVAEEGLGHQRCTAPPKVFGFVSSRPAGIHPSHGLS